MEIVEVQPYAPSPRFTPREIVRLTASASGVDLCFGQLRDVAFDQIESLAVFASGRPRPTTRLLLCILGQDRPFLLDADGVDYSAFDLPVSSSNDESLRQLLTIFEGHNPRLVTSSSTARFHQGSRPEEAHESEIPSLGTSLRVAGNPRLAVGLQPLVGGGASTEGPSAPRQERGPERRTTRTGGTEPQRIRRIARLLGFSSPSPPPPLLPPFGSDLRYGSHRRAELGKCFTGTPEPVRMRFGERLTAAAVALGLLLVPLLYLALLGGASYAIYHLAGTRGKELMEIMVSGAWNPSAFSFILTILLCLYFIVVLLSLLFPGRPPTRYSLFLKRNQEMVVFGHIEQLAKALKAPPPERIEVAIEADVAVAMRPRDDGQALTLTLGLPLVSGLGLDQLTGLLGREMALLAERSDSYLLRFSEGLRQRLERMLADCLERQERTARGLENRADRGETGLVSVLRGLFSFIFFSLARWLAMVFATLGEWIGGWSRRWLERAALQVEVRLVGAEVATSAAAHLKSLRAAHREVVAGVASPSSGMPRLDHLPAQIVFESLLQETSHNPPAVAGAAEPVFRSELPASVLFRDFAGLSHRVTLEYYRSQGIRKVELEPIEAYLEAQWDGRELRRSLDRYFAGTITTRRPLPVAPRLGAQDRSAEEMVDTLMGLRGEFEAGLMAYRQALSDYDVAIDCRLGAREAFKLTEADLEYQGMSVSEWQVLEEEAIRHLEDLGPDLQEHEKRSGQRLMSALLLLTDPDFGDTLPGAEGWRREVPQLLSIVAAINRSFQALLELRDRHAVLETLKDLQDMSEEDRRLALGIFEREIDTLYSPVAKLYRGLGDLANVFHFGGRDFGLAIRGIPIDYYSLSNEVLGRIYELYFRALSRLAYIAERIELASGLAPLPDHGAFPESRPWRA